MIVAGTGCFFVNSTQSFQVLNNVSDVTTVLTYESNIPYTYLGIPQSQFIQRDFTAKTIGMSTQCEPISDRCNLHGEAGSKDPFYCSEDFNGDLGGSEGWNTFYFTDSTMSSQNTLYGIHNPYYFAFAAVEGTAVQHAGLVHPQPVSPETVSVLHGGIAYLLFCTTTLYDIEYDSINGTVTRFVTTASNDSVANAWHGPISTTSGNVGGPTLQQASALGILSNTAQELADIIALAYSRTALALGAQAVMRTPALAAQERQSFLVSRVPAAPLFTLVIANLLFVVFGIALAAVAIKTSGGDVREVQARLSIVGLVADRFEGQRGRDGVEHMDDYFEEKQGNDSMRVAIDKSDAEGFAYKVWQKTG